MRASTSLRFSKSVEKFHNGWRGQSTPVNKNLFRRKFSSLASHFDDGETDAEDNNRAVAASPLVDVSPSLRSGNSSSLRRNITNNKVFVKKTVGNVNNTKKTMPRLEEMRKKLQTLDGEASGFDDFTRAKSDGENGTKRGRRKEPAPLKTSLISWREILDTAKAHYAEHEALPTGEDIRIQDNMLMDSFARKHTYLRISLGERCNLRCLYCMPPEGVPLQADEKLINANEVERIVKLFANGGVDKVRLTGGEPLLRKDLPEIISSIAAQPTINSVGITTNGITLSRHLPSLVDAGMTHANISLDTLDASKFEEITRRKGLHKVLKAIEDACAVLPQGHVKINCVVMKGFNDNELRDFVELSKDLPVDVRFIEWMPFNDNGWNNDRFLSYASMMDRIISDGSGDDKDIVPSMKGLGPFDLERLVDGENDTTKWWQAAGHEGRLGFITSMTEHFCGTCNRVRITADGQLKVCLFGSAEVSLRDAMREGASDTDLGLIVRAALQKKKFALGGHGNAEGIKKANNNRPMTLIGG